MSNAPPRLIVAGAAGDSGKTIVSLGLAAAWREAGLRVGAFKKGPDYIDTAWLSEASSFPARNLDAWLMGGDGVVASFVRHHGGADICVVEGNRGLFDGLNGTSTAALAKLLGAPLLLVMDVTKVTRTAAAFVAGCRAIDPDLNLGGVILNRVAGPRHEAEVRKAIEEVTDVPVLGAIPKLPNERLLPARHLGLVPPAEHGRMSEAVRYLAQVAREKTRLDALLKLAWTAEPSLPAPPPSSTLPAEELARAQLAAVGTAHPVAAGGGPFVRVGVFRDAAFTFYYPENLEALEQCGAELTPISALDERELPEIDLLYLGGGFPETHAVALSANRSLIESVRRAVEQGLPVYAECGGLVYLARTVTYQGRRSELCGVLDLDIVVEERPQGHGYAEVRVDRRNPFFPTGTMLRGHEFHYSRVVNGPEVDSFAFAVQRGQGSCEGRDGLVTHNVLASWLHVHALGAPSWAPSLVQRAEIYARETGRAVNRSGAHFNSGGKRE
ncbi:MAG: cobyrinate a,c-diamide synthase [Planctomycetota bacterium]